MQAVAAKTQKKIDLLHALIDHPRTGEDERDTARRMLARLLKKAAQDDAERPAHIDTRVYGSKYEQVKKMGLAEIAKLMRQDIKLARKIGQKAAAPGALSVPDPIADMPPQIKVSITSRHYSGGGSIDIRVKNIPEDWGFVQAPDAYRPNVMRTVPSPALAALLTELRVIHFAYNYDNSDIMTDYFENNYLGCVDFERPYDRH